MDTTIRLTVTDQPRPRTQSHRTSYAYQAIWPLHLRSNGNTLLLHIMTSCGPPLRWFLRVYGGWGRESWETKAGRETLAERRSRAYGEEIWGWEKTRKKEEERDDRKDSRTRVSACARRGEGIIGNSCRVNPALDPHIAAGMPRMRAFWWAPRRRTRSRLGRCRLFCFLLNRSSIRWLI